MGRHASLFAQIGNAQDMGGFEPALPLGNHRVAMVKYGVKESKKDPGVRVKGKFIILETEVKPGALHSWMWAIQGAGFVGQYARDRSKKFLQTVQSCLNNDAATDAFGDALDEMSYQQSQTGEIADSAMLEHLLGHANIEDARMLENLLKHPGLADGATLENLLNNPSLPQLPGSPGGLTAHEGPGHLIAKHIGKSDADLAARLVAEPDIPAASTFLTAAEADAGVAAALSQNGPKLWKWLASGPSGPLTLDATWSGGSVLVRGATASGPGTGVRIVLRSSGGGNWFLLTGFPLP